MAQDTDGAAVGRLTSVSGNGIDGSGQLGMDERVVEDKALSDLLEKRLRLADDKAEIGKTYKAADTEAKDAIAKLDLDDGDAVRVGRFRITKRRTEATHVEFERGGTSRIQIELFG